MLNVKRRNEIIYANEYIPEKTLVMAFFLVQV